ncbi:MAG: thioredoxin [Clostridia bacterium]|nr:thioredoxin [Clostridia bacterium]
MKPILVNSHSFDAEVRRSSVPVLLDFYADWCGPCRLLAPTLEALAAEAEGYKVAKLNVDTAPELCEEFRVMSIPTVIVFKNGEPVARAVGVRPREALLSLLEGAL